MMSSGMNLQLNNLSKYIAIFILLVFIDIIVFSDLDYQWVALPFRSNWPIFHRKPPLDLLAWIHPNVNVKTEQVFNSRSLSSRFVLCI